MCKSDTNISGFYKTDELKWVVGTGTIKNIYREIMIINFVSQIKVIIIKP